LKESYDYIVLGAGVAGLSFAHEVAKNGKSVLILEKDKVIGGLSKTLEFKGFRFDYCAHRFHTADKELLDEVKSIVGPNFTRHTQKSRMYMFNRFLKYPFELQNLLRAMKRTQAIKAIISFGINFITRQIRALFKMEHTKFKNYKDWFVNYFGNTLYLIMCEPYTTKIWKTNPDKLSADWADQRFQGVKLIELIKRVVIKLIKLDFSSYSLEDDSLAPDGGEFYYGETGAQDIPDGYERELKKFDSEILTKVTISKISENEKSVEFTIKGSDGTVNKVSANDVIISTIPLHDCYDYLDRDEPEVKEKLESLKYMDIIFVYLLIDKEQVSNDHWLYFPDEDIIFNRSVEFTTWSKKMSPEGKTALCLDITCFEGDETWETANQTLVKECIDSSVKVGLIQDDDVFDSLVIRVKDAYPFYDLDYKDKLLKIVNFIEGKNVVRCLGRTGVFRYNNSDGSIEMGIELAKKFISNESDASALDYEVKEISY